MSLTTSTPARTVTLPRAPILLGTEYVVCVGIPLLIFLGEILFTDHDPYASDGPVDSIVAIGLAGTLALALGLGIAAATRSAQRAMAGSIVLAVLSVVTLCFFWSGAPGVLGACAAWRAGLTRGGAPVSGPARVAGLIGAFIAGLNIVLTIGGLALAALGH